MGVKGLWALLEPAARPVRLEALASKRLAIDASIWLYQLLKAMKDDEGNPLEDAHILGFYRRICKLLYYGIRPVFVFDGAAPELKRLTIAERQSMRETKTRDAKRAAHQLLQTQLKLHALNGAGSGGILIDEAGPDGDDYLSPAKKRKRDEYELPPLHKSALATRAENERDLRMAHPDDLQHLIHLAARQSEAIGDDVEVDTESDAFKALSPEDQHDIIVALKVRSRQTSHDRLQHMLQSSETALDFSKQQIDLLVKRNSLTQQWLQVTGHSHRASGPTASPARVSAGRVAAERNREYMLIKSDQAGGGWTLRLGGDSEAAIAAAQPEQKRLAIVVSSSSDAEESDSSEFEDVPPIAAESPPPPQLPKSPPAAAAVTNGGDLWADNERGPPAFNSHKESPAQVAHAATNGHILHAAELPDAMSVIATDDEDYAEYVSSSSENGYADSDLDPDLLEMYDDYDGQERALALHEQQQREMRLQRERDEQALLRMPENEFLESWMQLVTKPMLGLDPSIYDCMRRWMVEEPTLVLEQVSWHVNRQLEKQPDISLDEPTDEWLVCSAGTAAGELYVARAKVARLSLMSNYLSYVLRWRQLRIAPSPEWRKQQQQQQQLEELLFVSADEQPSASDTIATLGSEPVNAIRDLNLSSSTLKPSIESLVDATSDSDDVVVVSEARALAYSDGYDDATSPAELELKLAHRDAIFERSRVLAAQGEHLPSPRENGAVHAAKHIDSREGDAMSDDGIVDIDESRGASIDSRPAAETVFDSDEEDEDEDARADLDTTKQQQSELLRNEQDEYALFVNKLRASSGVPGGTAT
ncbi:DNA repair protein rad2, partial [Coemansia sp. RSA 2052]